jgi:hypothetical protein
MLGPAVAALAQSASPQSPAAAQPVSPASPSPSLASPRSSAPPTPTRASFSEQFGVLYERNIFLRDRSVRRSNDDRPPSSQPARPLEESFIVRGIVLEDGQFRAYVEDTARSATTRLTAGDSVARGKVTRIDIDGIEYLQGEKPVWIVAGSDLTGRTSAASSVGLDLTTTPTTGPTTLPFDPNDPSLTIEQRMRLRRMQGR